MGSRKMRMIATTPLHLRSWQYIYWEVPDATNPNIFYAVSGEIACRDLATRLFHISRGYGKLNHNKIKILKKAFKTLVYWGEETVNIKRENDDSLPRNEWDTQGSAGKD